MKPTKIRVDGWVTLLDINTAYCRSNTDDILTFYNNQTKRETKDPSCREILMTRAFISLAPFDSGCIGRSGVGYRKEEGQHLFYNQGSLALILRGNRSLVRSAGGPRRTLPGDIGLTFTLAGRFHSPVGGIPYKVKKIKLYYEVEGQQCTY